MPIDRDTEILWYGHSTFSIKTPGGKQIVLDPWLESNPSCPAHLKKIEKCDILLVSHGHGDHTSDVIPVAQATGATVVANFEIASWFETKGLEKTVGMNKGGTLEIEGIKITMVHAAHSSSIEVDGAMIYAGEAAGFIIELENGLVIYFAGDTGVFGDMALIAELYEPEIAILPIGDLYTMGPKEAAMAVDLLNVTQVIPMHYGTFPPLTGRPSALRELLGEDSGVTVYEVEPGGLLT